MHLAQLQTEQTRFHQSMKPRFLNPTFASSNVGSSLGMLRRSESYDSLNRFSNNFKYSNQIQNLNMKQSNAQRITTQIKPFSKHRRSQSNLSNYGSNSLAFLRKSINDKQIYEKQQRNYNIVTVQPKEYLDTIKIYPKYRLQNTDENYFKKLKIENELMQKRKQRNPQVYDKLMEKKLNFQKQSPQKQKPMRGKMLNNVDQLNGVL